MHSKGDILAFNNDTNNMFIIDCVMDVSDTFNIDGIKEIYYGKHILGYCIVADGRDVSLATKEQLIYWGENGEPGTVD